MNQVGPIIGASADLCLNYIGRMATGVSAESFGRLARVGQTVIDANHPAFIVGHLAIYPARILADLGGDVASVDPSPAELDLFSPAARCRDDPDRTIYPPMDELMDRFMTRYEVAIAEVRRTDDGVFARENPNERMRGKFSTIGAMHAFYLGGHIMMHVGQWSTWRRATGLPPA